MENRQIPREWGNGIPKYETKDLMTKEEIHDFGVEIVAGQLQQAGYKILLYNPKLGSFPSIVAENKDEVIAVIVLTDIAPNQPKMRMTERFGIIGYCNGYKTKPAFASVSIGSTDGERFNKSLALVGDGYYAKYTGLEYISKEIPTIGTEEYKAFTMQFIGGYLRAGNYDAVSEYISKECIIKNTITKEEISKDALEYIENIFKEHKVTSHCIIKSVGNVKTLNVEKLYIKDYCNGDSGTVKILQDADKIGLLVVTETEAFDIDDLGIVFNVDFDDKGMINKIELIDPRLYEFKALEE